MVDMVQWLRNERSGQVVQGGKTHGTGRFVDRRNCHGVFWRYAWRGGCRAGPVSYTHLDVYKRQGDKEPEVGNTSYGRGGKAL